MDMHSIQVNKNRHPQLSLLMQNIKDFFQSNKLLNIIYK